MTQEIIRPREKTAFRIADYPHLLAHVGHMQNNGRAATEETPVPERIVDAHRDIVRHRLGASSPHGGLSTINIPGRSADDIATRNRWAHSLKNGSGKPISIHSNNGFSQNGALYNLFQRINDQLTADQAHGSEATIQVEDVILNTDATRIELIALIENCICPKTSWKLVDSRNIAVYSGTGNSTAENQV